MTLESLAKDKTVWSASHTELGLTEDQLRVEQKWTREFNDISDLLDWSPWVPYWTNGCPFADRGTTHILIQIASGCLPVIRT